MSAIIDTPQYKQEMEVIEDIIRLLINSEKSPEHFTEIIIRITQSIKHAEIGAVFFYDASKEKLRLFSVGGTKGQTKVAIPQNADLEPGEWIVGDVFSTRKPYIFQGSLLTDRYPKSAGWIEEIFGPLEQSYKFIGAPICTELDIYGVIILGTHNKETVFDQQDLDLLHSIARIIALIIGTSPFNNQRAVEKQTSPVDQMRAEALAILSHELRTPLASIKGYATALLMDEVQWPREKQVEFLQLIDNETENLQTMINEILDSSLIDIGQFLLEFQPVKLDRIAQTVAEEMQQHTEAHQIIIDFPQDFPIVDADQRRIIQVFRNIIDNAIKYSPNGGMIVIRGEKRTKDVVVSISDQGVGISPEDLIPLFNKYFRVKSATGYYIPGTGLGLPVARALIEEHQGKIWAESKVGEGTTLFFSLPLSHYEPDESG